VEVPVEAWPEDAFLSCLYAGANAEEVLDRASQALVVRSCLIEEAENSGRLMESGTVEVVKSFVTAKIDLKMNVERIEKWVQHVNSFEAMVSTER